jgi:protein O-GlcNAc transferase
MRNPCGLIRLLAVAATLSQTCAGLAQSSPDADAVNRAGAAFRAGYAAQQAGKLEEARTDFAQAAQFAPQIAESHEALGAVLLELDKPADAVPELESALKLKAADPDIETDLALAYARAGQAANAVPHFQAVLALSQQAGQHPVDATFCDSYARALAGIGKRDEAIAMFKAAQERGGDRADLDDAIGSLYAQMSSWEQARAAFDRAIATDMSFVPARVHLGVLLRETRDLPGSIAALSAAVGLDPNNPFVQVEYGRTLAAAGRDDDALPHLQLAAQAAPAPAGAELDLAMAMQRLGREQDAIPWFQKAIERDPGNTSALTNFGLALTLSGKAKDGLGYLQQALARQPDSAVIHKDFGVAHLQLSAFDEAIADFRAALALDPNDSQLHYDLGLAYKFKDQMDEAVAELTRAGELEPNLPDPPYTLGILYMQTGKLDHAVDELKKAVALRPGNGDAWAILGSTLKQDERLDEARSALEKAVELLPGQPGPLVTLAAVLADQASAASQAADASESAGDQKKADELRAQAKDLRAHAAEYRRQGAELSRAAVNRQKAAFALNAGNQLLLRGQIADAVARFQESVAADPTFAEAHIQLAEAYERQGRAADAAAERAKATSLAPAK